RGAAPARLTIVDRTAGPTDRQADVSSFKRFQMADLRFAAWLRWMTPLLTALSSLREASRRSTVAVSVSPACAASWNLRIAVFSDDLTDLLRSRRFSFCRLRLICDLMFATRQPRLGCSLVGLHANTAAPRRTRKGRG